jgi:hypothetical protein
MYYSLSNCLENPGNCLTREIEIANTNSPGLKFGQGVLQGDLQTLHYILINMHNLTPKIRDDMTFQM